MWRPEGSLTWTHTLAPWTESVRRYCPVCLKSWRTPGSLCPMTPPWRNCWTGSRGSRRLVSTEPGGIVWSSLKIPSVLSSRWSESVLIFVILFVHFKERCWIRLEIETCPYFLLNEWIVRNITYLPPSHVHLLFCWRGIFVGGLPVSHWIHTHCVLQHGFRPYCPFLHPQTHWINGCLWSRLWNAAGRTHDTSTCSLIKISNQPALPDIGAVPL